MDCYYYFTTLHMWDCTSCVCVTLFEYHCLIRLSLTSSMLSNDKVFFKKKKQICPVSGSLGKVQLLPGKKKKNLKKTLKQMHFSLRHRAKAESSLTCILDLTAKRSCQSPHLHRKVWERVSSVPNQLLINSTETTGTVRVDVCCTV